MNRTALAAVVLFLAASALPNVDFFEWRGQGDVVLYQVYSNQILDGEIPYRDFFMEYPPASLPTMVLPAIRGKSEARYTLYFKVLMVALGSVAVASAALILARVIWQPLSRAVSWSVSPHSQSRRRPRSIRRCCSHSSSHSSGSTVDSARPCERSPSSSQSSLFRRSS